MTVALAAGTLSAMQEPRMSILCRAALAVALVSLAACSGDAPADDTGLGDPPDTVLGDPHDGLQPNAACEEFEGTAVSGATTYFRGSFAVFDNGDVEGQEYWVLFPNQEWQSNGAPSECYLVWDVFGIAGEPDGCATCDYGVAIEGYFDPDTSDCPTGLEDAEGQDFSVTYNVRIDSSGEATWLFTSGTELGVGTWTDTEATYVSDYQCDWF